MSTLAAAIPDQDEFSVKEVADIVKKSTATVYRWIDEGFLHGTRRPKNEVIVTRQALLTILVQLD